MTTEQLFQEVALNLFRYYDFKSYDEIGGITIAEYNTLMKAVELRQVDMDYRNHQLAYLSFVVQGQKKAGKNKTKPVYPKFEKFYDYEKEINRVLGIKKQSRFDGIGKLLREGSEG